MREVHAVVPFSRDHFYLDCEQKGTLLFYGGRDAGERFVPVECAQNVALSIISESAARGRIAVGVCDERAAHLAELSRNAPEGLARTLPTIVLIRDDRAVAVQMFVEPMCEQQATKTLKVCTDVKNSVMEVARRLLTAFP